MKKKAPLGRLTLGLLTVELLLASGCSDADPGVGAAGAAQILFVASEGFLTSYDVETGLERPGTIPNVTGPVDMQAFSDGHVMLNLTGRHEVLVIDGKTMLEKSRIPSSRMGPCDRCTRTSARSSVGARCG
jgi:hypothetical protein